MNPDGGAEALQLSSFLMGLFGGLALFLYGMDKLTGAMKSAAGSGVQRILARLTTNRVKAAFAGAATTAVIQSSSVTTVLVVGFVSAGLMSLPQSIGVIMGANVGTTITAQIIAFKVTAYALAMIAIGFALMFVKKRERVVQYGAMLMGLGLLFFGMDLMGDAARPLRSYEPFIAAMRQMDSRWVGILIGAGFTALIQSSSAATGVIIVLAAQGFVTLEAGIALAFGANVGTCITALLAAIGKPPEAVRAALVHVIYNVAGVLIWLWLIDELAAIVTWLSPISPDLTGTERLAAETPRQIANAHTVFNVVNTLIFIWLVTPLAWIVRKIVPDRVRPGVRIEPKYLDDILLQTPALALDRVRLELRRLGRRSKSMVERALPVAMTGSWSELAALERLDDEIDELHSAIISYLGRLSKQDLGSREVAVVQEYISAANDIENIGDMIETNIVSAGRERLEKHVVVSDSTRSVLRGLHQKVNEMVDIALHALDTNDASAAKVVINAKPDISARAEEAERHLAMRLGAEEADRVALFRIESEMIEYLKRVYYFAKRIAKSVVDVQEIDRAESVTTPNPTDTSPQ